jgi:hypothetical protein
MLWLHFTIELYLGMSSEKGTDVTFEGRGSEYEPSSNNDTSESGSSAHKKGRV